MPKTNAHEHDRQFIRMIREADDTRLIAIGRLASEAAEWKRVVIAREMIRRERAYEADKTRLLDGQASQPSLYPPGVSSPGVSNSQE